MDDPMTSEALSRQDFLQQAWQKTRQQAAAFLPEWPTVSSSHIQDLRPPGALPEAQFVKACQPFCIECQQVCPREAIVHDAWGFPVVLPEQSPCVMCLDVPCTKVCPTQALTPLESPQQIAMGTAIIELTQCTAYQGSGCVVCYEVCPLPNQAIVLTEGLPEIVADVCTGCGVCVFECPTPQAMMIYPKNTAV